MTRFILKYLPRSHYSHILDMQQNLPLPDMPPAENFDMSLTKYDYFHGLLPREDVASLLTKDGDFLIRLSEADTLGAKLETVLSVLHDPRSRCRKEATEGREDFIMHIIIQYAKKKYFVVTYRGFNSVPELIAYYLKHTMIFKSQQVRLKQPVMLAAWEYLAENIKLEEVIANFGGGEVRKGKLLSRDNPPLTVAIKTVAGRSLEAKEKVQELVRECRLLRELNHPCITQYFGVCLISQPHCFILEYVSGGPLHVYLRSNKGKIRRDDLLMMVSCAGWGVEYLHKNMILHRDIAAKNCLYDKQFVKLIGFSLSKKATVYSMKTARRMAIRWMAPETLESFQYTQKSDVYGYGILEGITNDFTGNTPKKLSEVVRDKMWAKDASSRSTMHQIMLWMRVYTGMELQIFNAGNMTSATVRQNVDALVAKDVELRDLPNFKEPLPKTPLRKKKRKS